MNSAARTIAATAAALGFLMVGTVPAQAQGMMDEGPTWTMDGRGGIAVPAGDFADLAIDDVGPTFGLGVGYYVHPRVAIRIDGDVDLFSGDELAGGATGPDITLFHYNAGAEVELTPPGASPWDVTANVGAGATTWDTDSFTVGTVSEELSETYFTANGGLKVGYDVHRNVTVFLGGQWYLQFTDEADTQPLAELAGLTEGFDSASTIPIYAGLKLKF